VTALKNAAPARAEAALLFIGQRVEPEPPIEPPEPIDPEEPEPIEPDEPEPIDPPVPELLLVRLRSRSRSRVDEGTCVCSRLRLRFVVLVLLSEPEPDEPEFMLGDDWPEPPEPLGADICANAVPATSIAAAVTINVRIGFPLFRK
jgi:hypothetical protein